MRETTLIAEDLMLLLLDDERGDITGANTMHITLGGALLVELSLLGRAVVDEGRGGLTGKIVRPAGDGPLGDPVLQAAADTLAEKPRGAQTLVYKLGSGLWRTIVDRLVERGLVGEEERRMLGLFRTTRWPAADAEHEAEVRAAIAAVLVDGGDPDPRTAALVGLLSAGQLLHTVRPALPRNGAAYRRARAIERGDWGTAAVGNVVVQSVVAIAAASAAAAVAATTTVVTSN